MTDSAETRMSNFVHRGESSVGPNLRPAPPSSRLSVSGSLADELDVMALIDRESAGPHASAQNQRRFADAVEHLADCTTPADLWPTLAGRARDYLEADCGVVVFFDAVRGQSSVQAAEGPVLNSFWDLRCSADYGLLGAVATTGRSRVSYDYTADKSFKHLPGLDETVRDEGLRAHAIVPLKLGHQVIGAVYTADRRARNYTAAEVASLSKLARLATVFAHRLKHTDAVVAGRDEAEAQSRIHLRNVESLERRLEVQSTLVTALGSGRSPVDFARAAASAARCDVSLVDAFGTVAGAPLQPAEVRWALSGADHGDASAMASNRDLRSWALRSGADSLGALVARGIRDVDAVAALTMSASVIAGLLAARSSDASAQARERSLLISELAAREVDSSVVAEQAVILGFDLDEPNIAIGVHVEGSHAARSRVARACDRVLANSGGGAALFRGAVIGVVRTGDPRSTAVALQRELSASAASRIVVAYDGPASGMAPIRMSMRRAKNLSALAAVLNENSEVVSAADLGFVGMVLTADSAANGRQYVAQTVGQLLDYDRARGSELVKTVEVWFANNGQLGPTAKDLMVHVNTVSQRLQRVDALLGKDWRLPSRALDIQVAVRLNTALVKGITGTR